jgi:hypothetical protein
MISYLDRNFTYAQVTAGKRKEHAREHAYFCKFITCKYHYYY